METIPERVSWSYWTVQRNGRYYRIVPYMEHRITEKVRIIMSAKFLPAQNGGQVTKGGYVIWPLLGAAKRTTPG